MSTQIPKQASALQRRIYGLVGAFGVMALVLTGIMHFLAPSLFSDLTAGAFGAPGKLTIATAHPSGAYYAFGEKLRDAVKPTGLQLTVVPTQGTRENIELLNSGEVDLALVQGAMSFKHSTVRGLARVQDQLVHIVTRADSEVHSFGDLAGRRLAVGGKQSGFAAVAERLVAYYRLPTAVKLVYLPVGEMKSALSTGKVDAVLTVYTLFAPAIDKLLADGSNRLVPLAHTDALARFIPGMTANTIPDGAYGPGRSEPPAPLPTLSVPTLLVARVDLDGGHVRAVLAAIFGVDFIEHARLSGLNEQRGQDISGLSFHDDAQDYYSRNSPISSDHFEIASFFIAAMLAMASLLRYLQTRQADVSLEEKRLRIVPYFEQLLASGEIIAKDETPATLEKVLEDMMETAHRAEREWLAGNLDTEHMENLYAVFDVRCRNAFDKISRATPGSMPAKSLEEVSNDDSAENDDQVTDDSSDNV